jgi:Superinfection immunity protein
MNDNGEGLLVILFVWLCLIAIYLLPSTVAKRRRHNNRLAITVLNVLLGWSGIAWVIAMVWACTKDVEPRAPGQKEPWLWWLP